MKKLACSLIMLVLCTFAFSQNCLRVVAPTNFSGPDVNGKYTLSISYETDGNKTLQTVIYCDGTQIFTDCFQVTGNGVKVYSNLTCPGGLSKLSAAFTRRTGSCNSAQCGPVQVLPPCVVLPITFKSVKAVNIGKGQYKVYFEVDDELNIDRYILKISEDGITFKERAIIFADSQFSKGIYSTIIKL